MQSTPCSDLSTNKGEKLGIDAKGNYFYIKKVADHMKNIFVKMARQTPLTPNIRIECPIPVGMHKETVQALCDEFRTIFSDANVIYNKDFNAFFFDFL
jgi:hypothetical protein